MRHFFSDSSEVADDTGCCVRSALPFEDAFFDAVVASDVLEHVPPEWRKAVIGETLRTARRLVIFGFPCGEEAHKADEVMRQEYISRNSRPPVWLDEHMLAPFPEGTLFRDIPGWSVTQFGNENIKFHAWMMRRESCWLFRRVSTALRLLRRGCSGICCAEPIGRPITTNLCACAKYLTAAWNGANRLWLLSESAKHRLHYHGVLSRAAAKKPCLM